MNKIIISFGDIGNFNFVNKNNTGFIILDNIIRKKHISFFFIKSSYVAYFKYKKKNIYLIKSHSYMNNYNNIINYWLNFLKVSKKNTIILNDVFFEKYLIKFNTFRSLEAILNFYKK